MADTFPTPFRSDTEYADFMLLHAAPFWQSRKDGKITGKHGARLYWSAFINPRHTKAIVVVNGRIESCVKYQELFFDLFHQGYDVYSLDHRGQGYSDRLVTGNTIGHCEQFSDYVDDLDYFIKNIVSQSDYQRHFLLAHSMGGAISLSYALAHPERFDAIMLSAPMLGINMPPLLANIATPLTRFLAWIGHPATFALGQKAYQRQSFMHNLLTQSSARFEWFSDLYEKNATLQVGGASNQWVWQSLITCQHLLKHASDIQCPVLLLQGENDKVVSNDAMVQFYQTRQKACCPTQFHVLKNAKHELLFEKEDIRNQALSLLFDFMKKQSVKQ